MGHIEVNRPLLPLLITIIVAVLLPLAASGKEKANRHQAMLPNVQPPPTVSSFEIEQKIKSVVEDRVSQAIVQELKIPLLQVQEAIQQGQRTEKHASESLHLIVSLNGKLSRVVNHHPSSFYCCRRAGGTFR